MSHRADLPPDPPQRITGDRHTGNTTIDGGGGKTKDTRFVKSGKKTRANTQRRIVIEHTAKNSYNRNKKPEVKEERKARQETKTKGTAKESLDDAGPREVPRAKKGAT